MKWKKLGLMYAPLGEIFFFNSTIGNNVVIGKDSLIGAWCLDNKKCPS